MIKKIILFAVVLTLAAACGKKSAEEMESPVSAEEQMEIAKVVREYDYALIPTYYKLDSKPLEDLVTEAELKRVNMVIMEYQAGKKMMHSELKEIQFPKMAGIGKDKAVVETIEKWRYRHVKRDTGEVVLPWKEVEYKMRFNLVKMEEKWLVDKTEFIKK